ncbi:MAG: SIMPL domain-containing protein [Rhodocyclaceae bacterium]|nr:SIMPL domain-containing protein [Rhodocyclaceae bacterium]
MTGHGRSSALILGGLLALGLATLGYLAGDTALRIKQLDRSVTVKGLSEQEHPADIVIWPIQFAIADNDLGTLYARVDDGVAKVTAFLTANGVAAADISRAPPAVTDRSAQQYGGGERVEFRYTALQSVTVYSRDIDGVRQVMARLSELGRQGIAVTGGDYQAQTQYLFTRLNAIKPAMIEEATRNARAVAEKFAADSDSRLGKIRSAAQGQFSIEDRDANNPHIKKVRVVSTVDFFLVD